ncbi:MAG: pyridoxamine 5'-phosphate oxidase family protein [Oscillospiraceae bacterium]
MRRKDREMDEGFALSVADKCEYAVLSVVRRDGAPYGVPLSIARSGEYIYFHCAGEGEKVDAFRLNPKVCLTCVGDTNRLKDEFSTEYESAVIFGTASEVEDDGEKLEALRLICSRHTPENMAQFEPEAERSFKITHVWRIHISCITGKRKKYDSAGKEMKFGRME